MEPQGTKYILHGGFVPGKKQQDNLFFQEMLKDAPDTAKVLLVYFAEAEDKIPLRIEQDTEELDLNKGSKELEIRVASEITFHEDCEWADVIYLHGGKTVKIMECLSKYPHIKDFFTGKIVAGDSAGAHSLGMIFYSKNSKVIGNGLGVLPLKIMAHYEDEIPNPFLNIEPELETLLLHENETKVIRI